jgi:ABC-2 type transport system permease protein
MQDTHVAGGIAYEMVTSTLRRLFITPARRITLVLGISAYYLSIFTFQSVTLFVGAALIFGFRPDITPGGLAWAAFAFAAMIAVNLALGVVGAALTLAYKDPHNLLIVHHPMAIVSGAYFLIELAPQPFRTISLVNPMAYYIDGFRGSLTGKTLLISSLEAEMAVIAGIVIGFGVISALIYRRMLDRLGSIGDISIF